MKFGLYGNMAIVNVTHIVAMVKFSVISPQAAVLSTDRSNILSSQYNEFALSRDPRSRAPEVYHCSPLEASVNDSLTNAIMRPS